MSARICVVSVRAHVHVSVRVLAYACARNRVVSERLAVRVRVRPLEHTRTCANTRTRVRDARSPYAEELRAFSGRTQLRLANHAAHVRDSAHGGRDEPGKTEEGAEENEEGEDEQVEMIPVTLLQPESIVDNHRRPSRNYTRSATIPYLYKRYVNGR